MSNENEQEEKKTNIVIENIPSEIPITFKLYERLELDPLKRDNYSWRHICWALDTVKAKNSNYHKEVEDAFTKLVCFETRLEYNKYGDQGNPVATFKMYETLGLVPAKRHVYGPSDIHIAFIKLSQEIPRTRAKTRDTNDINDAWSTLQNVDKKSIYDKRGDECLSELDQTPATF